MDMDKAELVFRRPKLNYQLGFLGLCVVVAFFSWAVYTDYAARGRVRVDLVIKGAFALLLLLGVALHLRTARHTIRMTAEGIADTSAFPDLLPWLHVAEVSLEGSERFGYELALQLTEAAHSKKLTLDLATVDAAPNVVFGAAHERWLRARGGASVRLPA